MAEARAGLATQLEAFAANTMEYMRRSGTCCSTASACPTMRTDLEGRHVLVVVRGYDYREDLARCGPTSASTARS